VTDPSNQQDVDPELAHVLEVLGGAKRTSRDPDIELLVSLVGIETAADEDVLSVFARLVQDAYNN
jgi:hypothetical protein